MTFEFLEKKNNFFAEEKKEGEGKEGNIWSKKILFAERKRMEKEKEENI